MWVLFAGTATAFRSPVTAVLFVATASAQHANGTGVEVPVLWTLWVARFGQVPTKKPFVNKQSIQNAMQQPTLTYNVGTYLMASWNCSQASASQSRRIECNIYSDLATVRQSPSSILVHSLCRVI
jgi:H+/Cl- antiporter ClcA